METCSDPPSTLAISENMPCLPICPIHRRAPRNGGEDEQAHLPLALGPHFHRLALDALRVQFAGAPSEPAVRYGPSLLVGEGQAVFGLTLLQAHREAHAVAPTAAVWMDLPYRSTSTIGPQIRRAFTLFGWASPVLGARISASATGQARKRVAFWSKSRAADGWNEKWRPPPHSSRPPSQSGASGCVPGE